ncbi:Sugar isomerase (SIS) family protein [Abeliophyllum distichum]|uniref:Sugar isomerase (SIS) family protein n=1 Tax=Abeliophyllum distichum TaxID=126358 RepID=A0ABD1PAD5_9LAMI
MAEEPNSLMSALASQICNQISSVFTAPTSKPPAMIVLVEEIAAAASRNGKVFVYGVGREGLMLKALSMRLFHLGLATHCIFDMTTPPISSPDLLIASAGPGGFSTVDAICGVAKSNGARVLLLTALGTVFSLISKARVMGWGGVGWGGKEH